VGCKTQDAETSTTPTEEETAGVSAEEETASTSTEEDTSAATEAETETAATEDSEVRLYYEETAQVELISASGTRVFIDVYDPNGVSSPATENDVLLTTHSHYDHFNADFLTTFPGQQLQFEPGNISLSDTAIKGIVSSHEASAEPDGSNYIFIIDMGGLRIVHFGDIGQDQLTEEQLSELGKVDIAITQLANPFSDMSVENKKGFNLMEQVQPKLIIPTHYDTDSLGYAIDTWDVVCITDTNILTISRSGLPEETTLIVMGQLAPVYKATYDLSEW
jgi:hypothetical protein